jgi:thioredoxin reductase
MLVVGAGPAGLAAALEAARRGLKVVLVDEHPVDPALMGLDVPFHFGQRMTGAVRNTARMIEAIAEADDQIAEAFEAGVDVRLGTAVWGLFAHRPGLRWVNGRVAGLTTGTESWFMSVDTVVVATGRRDIGLAFPGWELPGIMGVTAATALLQRYDALDAEHLVVLGSGAEATAFAHAAIASGRRIAAIVEAAAQPRDLAGCAALAAAGVPILAGAMISAASGGSQGVERVRVTRLDEGGGATELACDTVVLAIGTAPVIELLDVAGSEIVFSPGRGGHVPATDADGRTSMPGIFAAGDCLGIWAAKTADRSLAADEGRRAALAACAEIEQGRAVVSLTSAGAAAGAPDDDAAASRAIWAAAAAAVAGPDTHVCQCEEVSLPDLLGVRPPRYLRQDQAPLPKRDLGSLASDGLVNQDQIKRLTRAGMGACQGRRCREQVGAILAGATRTPLAEIPLPSYRAPVRPLPLSAFAEDSEPGEITGNWEGWFGIKSQWVPFWETQHEGTDTAEETVK